MLTCMKWLSGRMAFLTTLTLLAALHLTAVTFAAIPPNRTSEAIAPSTGYLQPYFAQNWRLFAPNPVAQDRSIRFQVAYRDEAGDVRQTAWIDWTEVELDLVRHRLVGGRAGYITNKLTSSLSSRYRLLDDAQRSIVDESTDEAPLAWTQLEAGLADAGVAPTRVASYLQYERAIIALGTDVAASRFPEREVVAIRYAVAVQGVTPYEQRGGSDAERDAARPPLTERLSGWRVPITSTGVEREVVATFDEAHR